MSDSEVEFEYEYYDAEQGETSSHLSNGISIHDPEFVVYTCYKPAEVARILNNEVKTVANEFFVSEDESWQLCLNSKWNMNDLAENFTTRKDEYFVKCSLKSPSKIRDRERNGNSLDFFCQVCYRNVSNMMKLQCEHTFCSECWVSYFSNLLQEGVSSRIECMNPDCSVVCLRSFIRDLLADKPLLLQQYEKRVMADAVVTHPYFTFCPGNDCDGIVYCETKKTHRVTCKFCNHSFCVRCGFEYHAPSSCDIMAKWRKKCGDDSETANYISAHTKDCPNCHSCIEKNGGCNHMQCAKCKHHFCWMCFKDWKTHGSEYYECSRYKENPAIAQEANYLKARRALEKYLHYYERFDNHSKSLKLEEELRARIVKRIEDKVANRQGTWIDWQYLHDAATLLTKCRYTLQYTYPFAYYLESGQRQELFEYQQAQLEKEIEELSWKVERAETTDRADLEKQMHVAECKRQTLLQDFLS